MPLSIRFSKCLPGFSAPLLAAPLFLPAALLTAALLTAALLAGCSGQSKGPVVDTPLGEVQGNVANQVHVFRDLPYANHLSATNAGSDRILLYPGTTFGMQLRIDLSANSRLMAH